MYQSATLRIPRALPESEPLADAPDQSTLEAGATLACRTAIAGDTLGADGKAAIVLTLLGIMFTVLARFGTELASILRFGAGTGSGIVRISCAALMLGFAGCALCAVFQAFRTISPRFRKDKPSLAFFAEIAGLEREEYFARVESLTMRDAVDQILIYNHTAALICAEKFKQLRLSLRCFEAASVCWLLLIAILVFKSLQG